MNTRIAPPAPKYEGPARHVMHDADGAPMDNMPIHRIVIHGTVSPCVKGGRHNIAAMFRTTSKFASAHYVVDPGGICQVVYDSLVAEHAPPNPHSLGIELCDPQKGPGKRWHDASHTTMLRKAANLTAHLCLAYGVPIRKLSVPELLAGRHGICGHADVSAAWHQTDHTDPGPDFPWSEFMELVQAHAVYLQKKHRQESA